MTPAVPTKPQTRNNNNKKSRNRRVPVAPSVPLHQSPHEGVAHYFASLTLQMACACGAVGPFASLVTWRRRSFLFRFSGVANGVCVPMAPSVPSLRSSYDGVAHCFASMALHTACACGAVGPFASLVTWRRRSFCFASLALQTACACGAVGPFASLVIWQRRSVPRFAGVANGVCPWRRRSLRFARHMTASLFLHFSCVAYRVCLWRRRSLRFARHMMASSIASLPLRRKRCAPVALSVR